MVIGESELAQDFINRIISTRIALVNFGLLRWVRTSPTVFKLEDMVGSEKALLGCNFFKNQFKKEKYMQLFTQEDTKFRVCLCIAGLLGNQGGHRQQNMSAPMVLVDLVKPRNNRTNSHGCQSQFRLSKQPGSHSRLGWCSKQRLGPCRRLAATKTTPAK